MNKITLRINMNSALPLFVEKYMTKFGAGNWKLFKKDNINYKLIIVVPAVEEFENIKNLLISFAENDKTHFDKTLLIIAVNSIENSSNEVVAENAATINYLKSIINKEKNTGEEFSKILNSGLNIALVDINSKGRQMPENDGGVGLARKIGMDLALEQFDYSSKSKNILVCLDADCLVQNNYISAIYNYFNDKKCSAAYVQFEHRLENGEENNLAIICYEIFLRYYVLGLQIADSPYAFHTIGSTMACDAESYVKIQGMNKKKAAEDFYFMEKLAKNVSINKIDNTKVFPSARGSWRVPFGTGKSVTRFLNKQRNEYLLYSPKCFYLLKKWNNLFLNDEQVTASQYMSGAKQIHPELYNFLKQNNFEDNWNKISSNTKTVKQLNSQKKLWFDGFRTLKLIHHLRDNAFPQESMFDVLDEIFAYLNLRTIERNGEEIPSMDIQLEYLSKLRETA